MPGRDGMSTLALIREIEPSLPVIMVTKSEEEELMDEAIGNRIDDFLVKPLSPNRILPILKRVLDQERIIETKIPQNYTADFNEINPFTSNCQNGMQNLISWKRPGWNKHISNRKRNVTPCFPIMWRNIM